MKNSTVANPKEVISRKCLEKALPQIKFHWFTGEYDRADGYFQSVEDKYLVETKHRTNYTYEDIKHFGSIYIEVDKMNACLLIAAKDGYKKALYILTYKDSNICSILDFAKIRTMQPQIKWVRKNNDSYDMVLKLVIEVPFEMFIHYAKTK